jgi:peptidoglycan/xylan/chitin deacetylase (PgdA/CDA1 family)
MAWRGLARFDAAVGVSRFFPDSSNVVLRYHSVGGSGYGDVSPARLREDLAFLTDRYDVMDVPAVVEGAGDRTKQVAITFDDGFETFYSEVVPVLEEFAVPATVFVIADAVTQPGFRHDPPEAVDSYMKASQLRDLVDHQYVTVGNHTASHPRLSTVPDRETLTAEIVGARRRLGELLETDVTRFSYPYGDYDERSRAVVRDSHDYAVTVDGGHVSAHADPHLLPREDGALAPELVRWRVTGLAGTLRRTFG